MAQGFQYIKFLKSDSTEFKSIVNTFIDIALINTQIHFELYHNGKLIYRLTKAKNIKERMFEIIGNAANEYYDEKVIESSLCNITFILIKPENAKKTSNFQYIYVNNRRIDNKAIYTAIKEAYSGLIHRDLKPSYIVLIHIDPKLVDVNVHPRKLEVKFQDPQSIFRSVYSSVKKILGNSTKESLNDSIESVRSNDNIYKEVFTYKKPSNQNFQQYKSRPNFSTVNDAISFSKNLIESKSLYNTKDISIKPVDQKPINLRQYLNTYIVYELEDEIIFIDQHAAAEKINFEKLLYQLGTIPTKPLLIPAIIDLKDFEKEILLNKKEELKKIGIIIDDFGDNSVQVSEIPEILNNFDFFKYLENIVHDKEDFSNLTKEYTELEMSEETYQLLALTACHGSIRAGQKLNEFEMYNIINDLKSLKQPNNCPHGRPISWKLKKQEIEKNFKRII